MQYPLISIIIAVRNSEKTLPNTLKSIRKQIYPQERIEILVIDGKSSDQTRSIAKKFGCKIIDNPRLDFVTAKYIGFFRAKGKYALYLDSDEELVNPDSIKNKLFAINLDERIKGVISSGYISPKKVPAINHYINEFGDPFSFFMYRSTINAQFLLSYLKKNFKTFLKTKKTYIFDFSSAKQLPLLEFVEMGGMVDVEYIKKAIPEFKQNPNLLAHFLYIFARKHVLIAVTINDPINHYSSATFKKYLNKIEWRVRNNIYAKQTSAFAGFEGREKYQPNLHSFKRYLFIPYSLSIIFPFIDSLYLSLTRKNLIFLLHPILCIYTTMLIIFFSLLKSLGLKPNPKTYGS